MELKITRLLLDKASFYVIDNNEGTSSGMQLSELKAWLLDLGVDDSTIADVLDLNPNESMSVQVADEAA
jgi:hypothetical protein